MKFKLQARSFAIATFALGISAFASNEYIVMKNDCLSQISKSFLPGKIWGDSGNLGRILKLNPKILDPNLIAPGQIVLLPTSESEPKELNHGMGGTAEIPSTQKESSATRILPNEVALDPVHQETSASKQIQFQIATGMASISSQDKGSLARDVIASNSYVDVRAKISNELHPGSRLFFAVGTAYMSYSDQNNSSHRLLNKQWWMPTAGFGFSKAVNTSVKLQTEVDLETALFVRSANSRVVMIERSFIPAVAVKLEYEFLNLNEKFFKLSTNYGEKFGLARAEYNINRGYEIGADLEVVQRRLGSDQYALNFSFSNRMQDTNITKQSSNLFKIGLSFYFSEQKANSQGSSL